MENKDIVSRIIQIIVPLFILPRLFLHQEELGRLADKASGMLGWGVQAYRIVSIFIIVFYLLYCFKNVIYLLMEFKDSPGETLLMLNDLAERMDLVIGLAFRLFVVAVGGVVLGSVVYVQGMNRTGNISYILQWFIVVITVLVIMALMVRKFIGQWREFGDEIDSNRYDDGFDDSGDNWFDDD